MNPDPYLGIRHPLGLDAASGRLAVETVYERHVDQLIRQVLLTDPGERINLPTFGCGIRRMLFAPLDETTMALARVQVQQALGRWLGSVIELGDVQLDVNDSALRVRISYLVRARQTRHFLELEVT